MSNSIIRKMAWQNLAKNKLYIIPFLISSCLSLSLLFVIFSLLTNNFIKNRSSALNFLMSIGSLLITLITFIFILYSYRFIIKQRYKEFAIYNVLGLEKKHITKMLFYEQLILFLVTIIISIIVGYVFSQLFFLILNFVLSNRYGIGVLSFSLSATIYISLLTTFIYVVCYLSNVISIFIFNPIELLRKEKEGEKEPKTNFLILLLGVVLLIIGYKMAFSADTVMQSVINFFSASFIVIIATYALFIALSVFILKLLRKKKNYYYRPEKFLFISGMLYRIKSNATSLATISVVLTTLIIAMASSINVYKGLDSSAKNILTHDVIIDISDSKNEDNYAHIVKQLESLSIKPKDLELIKRMFTPIILKDNEINFYTSSDKEIPIYLIILDAQYLNLYHQKYKINDGEVYLSSNYNYKANKTIKMFGNNYQVFVDDRIIQSNMAVEVLQVVLSHNDYKLIQEKAVHNPNVGRSLSIGYNLDHLTKDYAHEAFKLVNNIKNSEIQFKADSVEAYYDLNGGFVFLFILIAVVMLNIIILITFYKQISEAYSDQKNYEIMINIGLEDKLIKKTTKNQILWIFFLPLLVAFIHSLASSELVSKLTFLFGNRSWLNYFIDLCYALVIIMVLYLIVYSLTSRIYYQIVNSSQKNKARV